MKHFLWELLMTFLGGPLHTVYLRTVALFSLECFTPLDLCMIYELVRRMLILEPFPVFRWQGQKGQWFQYCIVFLPG